MEPFVPIETVAKVSLMDSTIDLLEENHYLRLAAHSDYICKVLEEIVLFDTKTQSPLAGVTLVE